MKIVLFTSGILTLGNSASKNPCFSSRRSRGSRRVGPPRPPRRRRGKDGTAAFEEVGHALLAQHLVGEIVPEQMLPDPKPPAKAPVPEAKVCGTAPKAYSLS